MPPPFIKSRQPVQSLKEIPGHLKNPFVVTRFDKHGASRLREARLDENPVAGRLGKGMGENSQRSVQPKLLPVDFRSPLACHRAIELAAVVAGSEIVSKVRTRSWCYH
jgi:hypothetical protein